LNYRIFRVPVIDSELLNGKIWPGHSSRDLPRNKRFITGGVLNWTLLIELNRI